MANFNIQTRKKLYNEIKNIITTYFVNTSNDDLDIYKIEFDDYSDFFETIKLNYNIVKLLELKELLYKISSQLRRDIKIEDVDIINSIRGKLNIKKYIANEYLSMHTKKYFPCKVLRAEYNTIENEFLLLVIQYALKLINEIPINNNEFLNEFYQSGHWDKLIKLRSELIKLLHFGDFKLLIEKNSNLSVKNIKISINKILPIIKQKLRRHEISMRTYGRIVEWWYSVNSNIKNFDSLPLLLYSSKFDDKLFELWLLEQIKNSFINDFGMKLQDISHTSGIIEFSVNPLWKRTKTHIYQLRYMNNDIDKIIKIYFQKSRELMWDRNNKTKWIQLPHNGEESVKYLQGNLDIIITCDDSKEFDPVLIDAKNIYYEVIHKGKKYINPTVSEKVYKMVGYLDNFYKKVKKHNNGLGIIIFKNDKLSIINEKEYISDFKDSCINIFTIDPEISSKSLKKLTECILNHFGLLADRLKLNIELKDKFLNSMESKTENAMENQIQIVSQYISNSISILTRGKEDEINKYNYFLSFNIFGEDIWNTFEEETKKFLTQSEFLISSLKQCSSLEYSMFAINLAKAVENEINLKFIKDFRNYLLNKGITNHRYFVIDNIVKNKHLAIGQIGKFLKGKLDTLIIQYINTKVKSNDERKLYIEKLNILGKELEQFSKLRNLVAHKEGIGFEKFSIMRNQVMGVGLHKSLLKMIYDIYCI